MASEKRYRVSRLLGFYLGNAKGPDAKAGDPGREDGNNPGVDVLLDCVVSVG